MIFGICRVNSWGCQCSTDLKKIGKQVGNSGRGMLLRCSRLCNGKWEMKETRCLSPLRPVSIT